MLLFDWKLIDAEACKDGWVSLAHHGNGNENEWLEGLAKLLGPNQHGNEHMHAWCGGLENQNVWVISLISEENDFRFQLQDLWWTSLVFPASSIFCPDLVFAQWAQGLSQLFFRPMRLWWFSWTSRAWDFSRAFKLHWCGVRHDFCGLGGNFGSSTARMQACYWGWEKCLGKQERTHQANPQAMLLLRKSLWDGCGCPQWMSHVSCYFTTKIQRQFHRFWCEDDSGLVSKKFFTS